MMPLAVLPSLPLAAINWHGLFFLLFAAVACVVSYLCSGHAGIYRAQRVADHKGGKGLPPL